MKFDVNSLKFNEQELIPAIVQDNDSNIVLMMAWMNREAVEKTLQTGETWFWSRSRQKMWHKGESSGNTQKVLGIFYDCDRDTLLVKVRQNGAACHKGYLSCFHNQIENDGSVTTVGERFFDPEKVYGKK